jgi:hypothetical protein
MVFEEKFVTSLVICCAHDGIFGPPVDRQVHMQFDSVKHGMLFAHLVSNSKALYDGTHKWKNGARHH